MTVLVLKLVLAILIFLNVMFFFGMLLWISHPEGIVEHDGTEFSKIIFDDAAYYKALSKKKKVILLKLTEKPNI